MCKLIKMVTGCDFFSTLSSLRSSGKYYSIDMEAPTKGETDQEITLILNLYGLNDIHGPNGICWKGWKAEHRSCCDSWSKTRTTQSRFPSWNMRRQTKTHCSNEVTLVPGEKSRCCFARRSAYRAFAPGGVSYDEPSEDDPMGQSEVDPKPARSSVGASAKAHAAKARPRHLNRRVPAYI